MANPRKNRERQSKGPPTAWSDVAAWYDQLVGEEGSEYQREVIFPGALRMLAVQSGERILDVACGQGVFCRILQQRGAKPTGVDAARELIELARQRSEGIEYLVGDVQNLSFIPPAAFPSASCILAIQNIEEVRPVFEGVARALAEGGRFVIVMMHPCFRSPKESSWGWDEERKVQYRRVDRYLLPRKHPIVTHPGNKTGQYTWTFHRPISMYAKALRNAGLLVDALEEWPGHKTSTSGPRAAAENQARKEIPMFLAMRAVKATMNQE